MSLLGSVGPVHPALTGTLNRADAMAPGLAPPPTAGPAAAPGTAFGEVLDGLVGLVSTKQEAANAITQRVLVGDGQLHQSVLAMQEASVAFSLMVEVRNKLVESYQELMRMQL